VRDGKLSPGPVPAFVGPKLREHLEVFVNHLSERARQALVFLIVETRSDHECNKMMTPLLTEFNDSPLIFFYVHAHTFLSLEGPF